MLGISKRQEGFASYGRVIIETIEGETILNTKFPTYHEAERVLLGMINSDVKPIRPIRVRATIRIDEPGYDPIEPTFRCYEACQQNNSGWICIFAFDYNYPGGIYYKP